MKTQKPTFKGFSMEKRVKIDYSSLDLRLVHQLQSEITAFEETTADLRGKAVKMKGLSKRQKVESKSKW